MSGEVETGAGWDVEAVEFHSLQQFVDGFAQNQMKRRD